jgi:MFS family permease
VGSALPHAFNASNKLLWYVVVLTSSALAIVGAIIAETGVHEGPYRAAQVRFDPRRIGDTFGDRRLLLANLGYLGHMWELYSMWGWIAVMLAASAHTQRQQVEIAAFAVIAVGAVGCVWAGRVADRTTNTHSVAQRARVTIIAMAVSGACCLLAAVVFHHFYLLLVVALVWGVAVIADSAQFSAIVSEASEPAYVGTALTTQTALGFLLTAVSIRVIAWIGTTYNWRWAAAAMAIGPALGALAMMRLTGAVEEKTSYTGM